MHNLKYLLFGFILFVSLYPVLRAEEVKPAPTVERLQVEVDALKSELAQLRTSMAFEGRICNAAVQAAREFVTGKPVGNPNPAQLPPRPRQHGADAKAGSQQP